MRTRHRGALLFIDLDHLKETNDAHGHEMGDLLLLEVGRRLRACVRDVDTVARLGGDEFVVMLEYLDEDPEAAHTDAARVGEKILAELRGPFQLRDCAPTSSASIGVVLFSGQDGDAEEILRRADAAMYGVKARGRNGLAFYTPEPSDHGAGEAR